ncbi:MAG TPA: hypothetical protein VI076_06755 [Actinopolymorphaceae bacterium]
MLDLAARGTLTPPVPVVMPFGEYARALDTALVAVPGTKVVLSLGA